MDIHAQRTTCAVSAVRAVAAVRVLQTVATAMENTHTSAIHSMHACMHARIHPSIDPSIHPSIRLRAKQAHHTHTHADHTSSLQCQRQWNIVVVSRCWRRLHPPSKHTRSSHEQPPRRAICCYGDMHACVCLVKQPTDLYPWATYIVSRTHTHSTHSTHARTHATRRPQLSMRGVHSKWCLAIASYTMAVCTAPSFHSSIDP